MALDYAAIGKRISYYRTKQGLTQADLANLIFVTRKHISQLEIGLTGPSLEMIVNISNVLHVSIEDLLADSLQEPSHATAPELIRLLMDCPEA